MKFQNVITSWFIIWFSSFLHCSVGNFFLSLLKFYLILEWISSLKINACRIFLHTFWVVIHCPYPSLYCEITEFMKSGARKKIALFVNRPIWRFNAWHKNSMHTMEHLLAHWIKMPLFPNTLLNKTDVWTMKITIYCKEWPLKLCIIKFSLSMLIFKWITSWVIKKCQTGTYFFGWVYIKARRKQNVSK